MLSLKEFIRYELKGWKRVEIIGLLLVFFIISFVSFLNQDSLIAFIYAICGILYTIIAGKGKISCYFFGIISSICYSLLTFSNALWGNLILNILYYIPMEVIGIIRWKKYLKKDTKEIIKTQLSHKQRLIISGISIIACVFCVFLLKSFKDTNPIFDGITTILSIVGMYLTVKRCIEQWIIWMIVNGFSVLMWLDLVIHGARASAAIIVWSIYFVLAVYFFFMWKKDIQLNCYNVKK